MLHDVVEDIHLTISTAVRAQTPLDVRRISKQLRRAVEIFNELSEPCIALETRNRQYIEQLQPLQRLAKEATRQFQQNADEAHKQRPNELLRTITNILTVYVAELLVHAPADAAANSVVLKNLDAQGVAKVIASDVQELQNHLRNLGMFLKNIEVKTSQANTAVGQTAKTATEDLPYLDSTVEVAQRSLAALQKALQPPVTGSLRLGTTSHASTSALP